MAGVRQPAALPHDARELLARSAAFLEARGLEGARREAELLVCESLGLTQRVELYCQLDRPLEAREIERARELVVRRAQGEPTAYLLGRREFYGRNFKVGPGVLVPRPETEQLVDLARSELARREPPCEAVRIADFGTGCGCLAVSLALEVPSSHVLAFDISEAALVFARENARLLGVAERVRCAAGDGLGALQRLLRSPLDVLVSNPPYIDPAERASLATQVREYEPEQALFAPAGAVDHWCERLLEQGLPLLAKGASLLVELGQGQGARVLALAERQPLTASARLEVDLAGIARVLVVRRN